PTPPHPTSSLRLLFPHGTADHVDLVPLYVAPLRDLTLIELDRDIDAVREILDLPARTTKPRRIVCLAVLRIRVSLLNVVRSRSTALCGGAPRTRGGASPPSAAARTSAAVAPLS